MHDFFKKHGVAAMTIRELFDFIVDSSIADEAADSYLEKVQQKILARGDISVEDEIADSVFVQSFIPKTLEHVKSAEEDVRWITSGQDTRDMYYQTITRLKHALSITQRTSIEKEADPGKDSSVNPTARSSPPTSVIEPQEVSDEENSNDTEESSSSETELEVPVDKKVARKENKKKVKEEKREARKGKCLKS